MGKNEINHEFCESIKRNPFDCILLVHKMRWRKSALELS